MTTHPLRRYREKEGISLAALGEKVGRSKASISRIETGGQKPSPELARALEAATGISRSQLRPDIWNARERA